MKIVRFANQTSRLRTSSSNPKSTKVLFPRHSMGLSVLVLLFCANGISLTHAIQAETQQQHYHGGGEGCKAGDNGAGTCDGMTNKDCISTLRACLASDAEMESQVRSLLLETVPRGGHSHSHAHHDHGDPSVLSAVSSMPPPYGIPLHGWKIIFQVLLTSMNVLCWYVPLNQPSLQKSVLGMSIANAFSGGVFLSLAFGHLIPECVAGFSTIAGVNEVLPYMLVLSGYLLIFFVEKVAFDAHGMLDHGHSHSHSHAPVATSPAKQVRDGKQDGKEGSIAAPCSSSALSSGRSAVILLGALAVHSVLEMASLGLSSNFADSALLSLSIALHQPAESLALLVAFMKSGMPKEQIIRYLAAFSAMGPIGTAMGMAVKEYASPMVDAVMLAVVAGTFVYVGATEVIPEEFEDQRHKWAKFTALITGITSIFAITQYTHSWHG